MRIGEAKISALLVAGLAGAGLTLMFAAALRSFTTALSISVPITLVLGIAMFLTASDEVKDKGRDKPKKPDDQRQVT
jgi:hypothetical protein